LRVLAIGFALLAIAAFAGVWVLAGIAGGAEPGPGLPELWLDSGPLEKISDMLLVLCIVGAVVIGLIRDGDGRRSAAAILAYVAWATLALAALTALQAALRSWAIARMVHVTNFRVVAPSLAEAVLTLGIGLLCAALCFALAPPRRATPETAPA
jgi:hypothetical protein